MGDQEHFFLYQSGLPPVPTVPALPDAALRCLSNERMDWAERTALSVLGCGLLPLGALGREMAMDGRPEPGLDARSARPATEDDPQTRHDDYTILGLPAASH